MQIPQTIPRADGFSKTEQRPEFMWMHGRRRLPKLNSPNHNFRSFRPVKAWLVLPFLALCCAFATCALADDEFVGPFTTWLNIRNAPYNAKGDGVNDDSAAIQAAINDAANNEVSSENGNVVYLPAGTYLIRSKLQMQIPGWAANHNCLFNISLIGADPITTTITWGGAVNTDMLLLNDCQGCKVSRLTFDGNSKSAHFLINDDNLIQKGNGGYAGENEFSDLVLNNGQGGIIAGFSGGDGVAESVVVRCTFKNCNIGFGTWQPNALDWWVRNCTFNGCGNAVENVNGSSAVTQCVFLHSTINDIKVDQKFSWNISDNYSLGSACFFNADTWSKGPVNLQRNVILDYTGPTAIITPYGNSPVTLIDNTIRSLQSATGPVVIGVGMLTIGNTFTISNKYSGWSNTNVDDVVLLWSQVTPSQPILPGTLPNMHRAIYEVASGASGTDIQNQINNAASFGGDRPVVHIPAGKYNVSSTLIVPANKNVQLMGDGGLVGNGTTLNYTSSSGQPVLKLAAPSHATVRDLTINGNLSAPSDCIEVDSEDSPGSRVFFDWIFSAKYNDFRAIRQEAFVKVDSLDNTIVEAASLVGDPIHVSGGPRAQAGTLVPAILRVFGADSKQIKVESGGSMLTAGLYSEGESTPMAQVTNADFTIQGSTWKHVGASPSAEVVVTGPNAWASFLGVTLIDSPIGVQGNGADTKCFTTGFFSSWITPRYNGPWLTDISNPGAASTLLNCILDSGTVLNQGPSDLATVRSAAALTRANPPYALPLGTLAQGVTDARIYRVAVSNGANGVHVTFSGLPSGWSDNDIGSPGSAGSASYNGASAVWTVAGGGGDIWNTSDQFNFATVAATGDQTLIAKVTGITNTDPWAKAGVMIRDSSAAGSMYVNIVATQSNGVAMQWRNATNGWCSFAGVAGVATPTATNPVWLQLVKAGSTFRGYYSTNGSTWMQVGTTNVALSNSSYLAGLAVTAHNNSALNTATFANVSQ